MKNTLLLITALLVIVPAAAAQTEPVAFERYYYLEPSLGVNWMDQETGHSQPADAGIHLGLAGGWRFHRRWALELHTGFLHNVQPATTTQDEYSMTQVPLVPNLVFHFPNSSRLEPYLGAGLGIVYGTGDDRSGTDGALEFMAGARYRLNERLELGLSYRFIMVAVASIFAEEAVGNDTANLALKIGV